MCFFGEYEWFDAALQRHENISLFPCVEHRHKVEDMLFSLKAVVWNRIVNLMY